MAARFSYFVADRTGRRLRGEIDAANESDAADQLRQRGDTVIEIGSVDAAATKLKLETRTHLTDAQLADFAFELRALMASGLSLPKALATLADGSGSRSASTLARDLKLQLELGNTASDALIHARTPGLRLLGRFLAAAEQGGRHDMMLRIAADFLGQRSAAFQRIRSALAYPAFLLAASLAAIAFLIVQVSPALAPLFEGGEAPGFIAATAGIGQWVQDNFRLALLIAAGIAIALFLMFRSPAVRASAWHFLSLAPFVRRIAAGLDFGPALMAYAALLRSGWPAERALRLSAEISGGRAKTVFLAIASKLRDGATLANAFHDQKGLPLEAVRAIAIGEATGTAGEALGRAAENLIARTLRSLDRFSAVAGPVLIALIGGFVAIIMLSLLSSIASLGDAVS